MITNNKNLAFFVLFFCPPGICNGIASPGNQLLDLYHLGLPNLLEICWENEIFVGDRKIFVANSYVCNKSWIAFPTWIKDPVEEAFVKEASTEMENMNKFKISFFQKENENWF